MACAVVAIPTALAGLGSGLAGAGPIRLEARPSPAARRKTQ
ncbi:MAG: hypothetical protein RLY70_4693 [Planctomycetota bacterium]